MGVQKGGKLAQHFLIDQPQMCDYVKKNTPELSKKPWIKYISCRFGEEKWWEKLILAGFNPKKPR